MRYPPTGRRQLRCAASNQDAEKIKDRILLQPHVGITDYRLRRACFSGLAGLFDTTRAFLAVIGDVLWDFETKAMDRERQNR